MKNWGMLAGALLAGILTLAGVSTVYGIHGGVLGLALNFMICIVGTLLQSSVSKNQFAEDEFEAFEMEA